jgi:hypothetical protein
MTTLKTSELMMRGYAKAGLRQTRDQLFDHEGAACALGCVVLGFGVSEEQFHENSNLADAVIEDVFGPLGWSAPDARWIMDMNDNEQRTIPEILGILVDNGK